MAGGRCRAPGNEKGLGRALHARDPAPGAQPLSRSVAQTESLSTIALSVADGRITEVTFSGSGA